MTYNNYIKKFTYDESGSQTLEYIAIIGIAIALIAAVKAFGQTAKSKMGELGSGI